MLTRAQALSTMMFRASLRELAFGLAASVAWADRRTPPSELRFLKALQQTFELGDEDVARLFELAEYNAPLPPTESR